MIRPAAAAAVVMFVAYGVAARSGEPPCMTLAQARAVFPGKHLWWHRAGGGRCWDSTGPARRGSPSPVRVHPTAPDTLAQAEPTVLYPNLIGSSATIAGDLFKPEQLNGWPILLDIDEATSDAPPECCWPKLSDEPPADFSERWHAMPSDWFRTAQRPQ